MKTYIQPGSTVTVLAPYALSSGDGALVGSIFGVATADAESGAETEITREGVFTMAKVSAQAWTAGVKVYWDNSAKVVTTTASGNTLIGAALEAAANPTGTGTVLLTGAIA